MWCGRRLEGNMCDGGRETWVSEDMGVWTTWRARSDEDVACKTCVGGCGCGCGVVCVDVEGIQEQERRGSG